MIMQERQSNGVEGGYLFRQVNLDKQGFRPNNVFSEQRQMYVKNNPEAPGQNFF